ncbi:cation diffusion facilitator family transporter [Turneriella parva]|uniref:Cation diffusion facilitator family transporter n=1 Tax=Turneriella parva (strain ATCC BAA-1111 / DSM 21527 / NCTC 11395 / H) TaxID=869212 RepID=I4B629_TURPD|nr:cation diffusion facilitator family transporter [Turneriella parva]AFM12736.1 cation diffusion facilitator family transporter [Turneriella parva DSM 21527]
MQTARIKFGALVSLSVSTLLLIVKFIAYYLTHSQAIFSDALESIVNVVAASLALFVIYISSKPADRNHPYGHGKAEYFSSTVEGALISFAAVMIGIESVNALVSGQSISRLDTGLALIVAAGVANALLGLYLVNIGKKSQSAALVASGKHVLSDSYTSAAVIVGLGAVKFTGIREFDAVAALAVAAVLAFTGFRLVRDSVHALMDAEDTALVDRIAKAFTENRQPGIIRIHHTRVIRAGKYHHIDAHVVVPEFWSVSTAHEQTAQFEADVMQNHDHQGEIHFHIDPCRRVYCHACDLEDCKIRREPFAALIPFSFAELTSPTEPEELQHPPPPANLV